MMNLSREITDTYDVLGEIGQGGGGIIYEAYHKRLRKKVVLKKQHEAIRGLVNERTETDTLKKLRHSYLPQVLDFIVTEDAVFTVMDYIPGQSVKDILKERGRLSEQEVIKYAGQLCDALVYLHNSKPPVIHGDIKPDNIMITPEGDVCLIDFNISSALSAANSYAFGFTPGYAAPEQRRSFEYRRNVLKAARAAAAPAGEYGETVLLHEDPSDKTVPMPGAGIQDTVLLHDDPFDRTVPMPGSDMQRTVLLYDHSSDKTVPMPGPGVQETVLLHDDPSDMTVPMPGADMQETVLLQDHPSDVTVSMSGSPANVMREEKRKSWILYDKRSDIYSFGATLYHMLTGIKPSSEPGDIKPVLDIYPMMNRGLADIITRSLEAEPENRFQSFDEIKKILDNIKKYDLKYRAGVVRRIVAVAIAAVIAGIIAAVSLITLKNTGEKKYKAGLSDALELYYSGDHEGSIECIDDRLIDGFYFDLDKTLESSAYHLRANDLFEMKQYDSAVHDYDEAIKLDPSNALIYRDKAIALARAGEADEAVSVLNEAADLNTENVDLMLANAEIEASRGNTDEAIGLYKECIEAAEDDQTKARAGMLCASLYDHEDEAQLSEAISVLEKASGYDSGIKASVLEQLAQCYISMAGLTGDVSYYDSALGVFTQIADKGWDTYTTHNNMAIIYEQTDDLEAAEDELDMMLEKYGDNYNTYKRLAFLEIDKQEENAADSRDYSRFKEYYNKAEELYKTQSAVSDDMEMNVLEKLIGQI